MSQLGAAPTTTGAPHSPTMSTLWAISPHIDSGCGSET